MTTPSFFITPGYGTRLHDALHYSQAMRIGDRVEISGQGGWNDDLVIPESIEEEIEQAGTDARDRRSTLAACGPRQFLSRRWIPSRDQRNNGQAVSPLHARPRSNLDAVGNRSAGASNHAYRNSRNSYHRLTPRFVQAPCRANPARPAPASPCISSYREIRLSSACSENGGPPWPGWRASAACGRWPALPGA